MANIKRAGWLALATGLLASCVTSTVTNLTPQRHPRNPTGLYTVEYAWDSSQQTIRPQSITPQVIVGLESYPMRPTLNITNRWEALVPVPTATNMIRYHFKVDYEYNRFGAPGHASLLSPEYKLVIVD